MAAHVLQLEDLRCLENSIAGGKAAGLAAAKSVGLPVLDGVVVPTSAAIAGLRAGVQALTDRGSGGARRATMSTALDDGLASELRAAVATLGGDVVVRSSATVESSGEWSGAFSTFAEIGPDEVATAVQGCWTSVFGVDAIERAERVGVRPEDISMAVLVQPRIVPRVAGLARVRGTIVEIDAVAGSPAALMAGWATGQRIEVTDQDEVRAPQDPLLDVATARDVAALARRTFNLLGDGVIEWAWTGYSVVLLQSGPAEDSDQAVPVPGGVAGLDQPSAQRVARLALAFPGQLCDELVLPWALGMRDPDALIGSTSTTPHDFSLAEVRNAAGRLAAQVWGLPVGDAVRECGALLRGLRGSEPEAALDRLDLLAEPNMAAAAALLGGLRSVGARAAEARKLHRADDIFGCGAADLSDTRTGEPRQSWKGARRWEPFLVGVAQTLGEAYHGIAASRGVGAGSARIVADPHAIPPRRRPREVIVAPTPVPALSSQLWDAAGLVTTGGSAAAHLMEVARSLGVPAVAACALPFPLASLEGALLAVDGEHGMVSHWAM